MAQPIAHVRAAGAALKQVLGMACRLLSINTKGKCATIRGEICVLSGSWGGGRVLGVGVSRVIDLKSVRSYVVVRLRLILPRDLLLVAGRG